MNSETRTLRTRLADGILDLDRRDFSLSGGVSKFLGKVIDGGMIPTTPDKFCLVNPTDIDGAEVEGGNVVLIPDTTVSIPGIVLGQAPIVGDYLVFSSIGGRWIARKRVQTSGGSTIGVVTIPNCFCQSIPTTLTMTSLDPTCNYRMFQSCTIQWQPVPPEYGPLALGSDAFLSNESFPDPIAGGAIFRYLLNCTYNQFSLTRIYAVSPYGSPFRDGILYTWLIGADGNTCLPFHMDNGSAFPGSDLTCDVTIDS